MTQEWSTQVLLPEQSEPDSADSAWLWRQLDLAKRASLAGLRAAVFAAIVFVLIYQGMALRKWLYPASVGFRAPGDINNAWGQGFAVLREGRMIQQDSKPLTWSSFLGGYLNRYDTASKVRGGRFDLDYPPARLLIVSTWVLSMSDGGLKQPPSSPQQLAGPLLTINIAMSLTGAVAAFLLARHVLRRRMVRHADFIALAPAALLWFNPAILLNAHVWPQWDVWLVPFYLFAAYFAATRRWMLAGACLSIGAMFKGQILLTAALFVLWPLFQWRLRAVLDVTVGVLLAAMVCTSPWMLRTPAAWVFFLTVVLLMAGGVVFIHRDWRITYICGTLAVTLLLAGTCFDGSFGWWSVGLAYGTHHHMALNIGPTDNLAALLAQRGGWNLNDVIFTINWPRLALGNTAITIRTFIALIYAAALVLCAIGLARHDARDDRRMLIAIATPWVLMFAFMPQMHERYLVWGAAITALAAAVSVGGALLHLVIAILGSMPIAISLCGQGGAAPRWLVRVLHSSCPDAAWAVLLAAGILLYLSLTPSPASARSAPASVPPDDEPSAATAWPESEGTVQAEQ